MNKQFLYKTLRKIRQIDLACWHGRNVGWGDFLMLGALNDYLDTVDPAETDKMWQRVIQEMPLVTVGKR